MNEESRPGEKAAPTQTNTPSVPPISDPIEVDQRRREWARRLIDRRTAPVLPEYGSAAWSTLPDGHPDQIAAVVVAAEAWADRATTFVSEYAAMVRRERAERKRVMDAAYLASFRGVRR